MLPGGQAGIPFVGNVFPGGWNPFGGNTVPGGWNPFGGNMVPGWGSEHNGGGDGSPLAPVTLQCSDIAEYKELLQLASNSECSSINNVILVLDTLRKAAGRNCMEDIIDKLNYEFRHLRTPPSHCACSGDLPRQAYNTGLSAHYQECFAEQDQVYSELFHKYFSGSSDVYTAQPPACEPHHLLWYQLTQVHHHSGHVCQADFIHHLADAFRYSHPSCTCFQATSPSPTTTIQTTGKPSTTFPTTLMPTTTMPITAAPTPITSSKPMTTLTTTTQAMTSATVSKMYATSTAKPGTVTFPYACDKSSLVVAMLNKMAVSHPMASPCAPGDAGSSEDLVLRFCNIPDLHWRRGQNVMGACDKLPLYTPVATFMGEIYNPGPTMQSGILLGCLPDGFQLGVQHCKKSPTIEHVTFAGGNPNNYFLIKS